jgi:uncharacterized protein with gpF-like domain
VNIKTLEPVRPNMGAAAAYKRKLQAFVDNIYAYAYYRIVKTYRANPPRMAADASSAVTMQSVMDDIKKNWDANIKSAGLLLGQHFAMSLMRQTDLSMSRILRTSGFSVQFNMTPTMREVMNATVSEQVSLIRSIEEKFFSDIECLVMRSVSVGRDLKYLTDELEQRYDLTRKRAAFIALDQNNKATATLNRVRQKEIGIRQAVWVHSGASHEPRPSHVNASKEHLIYDIDKGAFLDGEWIHPGELINCRCVSRPIIPGLALS